MPTTIQISEETKKRLFFIINKLERKCGKRITYDEAIKYLLEENEEKFDKDEFIENMKKFKGVLKPEEGKKLLKELREKEIEREQEFER
ncbi:MAG: hypothetical protein ACTSRH_12080 [Promethearchaeota archaeon]